MFLYSNNQNLLDMKGQTQAVTAVLITGVIVGSVASAYVWGVPLIEKRQGQAELNTLESSVLGLESSIASVAGGGGGSSGAIELDLGNGEVYVNETGNYIDITAYASGASYSVNSWDLLRGENRQGLSIGAGKHGNKGTNSAGVVMASMASQSSSAINYRVEFRNLKTSTPSGPQLELIDLQSSGAPQASGEVEIYFSNEGRETDIGDQGVELPSGERLDRSRTVVEVDLR